MLILKLLMVYNNKGVLLQSLNRSVCYLRPRFASILCKLATVRRVTAAILHMETTNLGVKKM